jgi:hypothetical protein
MPVRDANAGAGHREKPGGAPPALPLPWHRWNGHFDRAIYHVPRPQSEPRFGCETIFWMQYSHHQVGRHPPS